MLVVIKQHCFKSVQAAVDKLGAKGGDVWLVRSHAVPAMVTMGTAWSNSRYADVSF